MEEHVFNQVVGQVLIYDTTTKQWLPAGTSSGLSMVRLIYSASNNTYRIHGQKIDGAKEVVLDNVITVDDKFNRANNSFVSWHDKHAFWGLNFRPKKEGPNEADIFFNAIKEILSKIVGQVTSQSQLGQQPSMAGDTLVANKQSLQQQNSASVIQRPIQTQQQISHHQAQQQQQAVHQTMLHQQQQAQMMNMRMMSEQHQPQTNLLSQGQPTQIIQQQSAQPLIQQQQMHPQFMQQQQQQQQPQQPQSHPNHNPINHYQHAHQQHLGQQYPAPQQVRQPPPQPQMQQQQQPQMQQQPQPTQAAAAPIPPPPPPPPPAPPIAGLSNGRINGQPKISTNNLMSSMNSSDSQHSPVSNNNSADRNGGSPNQQTSILANELAKCQLKKVNLSRSDSEKESECNNNNVGQPKTTRASSLVPDNFMSEMKGKLASRREKVDQEGNAQSNCSSSNLTNGSGTDKSQEGWLADLIQREISKGMAKMKADILEAIRSELKQR